MAVCKICASPQRLLIEKALVAGESVRIVGERFGMPGTSVWRHKNSHIGPNLRRSQEKALAKREEAVSDGVLGAMRTQIGKIDGLYTTAEAILQDAQGANDTGTALKAIRELSSLHRETRGHWELVGQLTGELGRNQDLGVTNNILVCMPTVAPAAPTIKAEIIDAEECEQGDTAA